MGYRGSHPAAFQGGIVDTAGVVLAVTAVAAGVALSEVSARLIAVALPRLGPLPSLAVRSTTAALTGVLCAAIVLRYGIDPLLPALFLLGVLGVQLSRIDAALHLLPNPLVLVLGAGGFVFLLLPALLENELPFLLRGVIGAAIGFIFYLVLAIITPGAMGMGDVKLAAPLGLYLGYLGWSQLLHGILLGLILNGLAALVILAFRRGTKPKEVAHGPSMIAAAAAVTLFA